MSEKQDGREHIDRTVKHLVEKLHLPADYAKKVATEARIRNERREDGQRK